MRPSTSANWPYSACVTQLDEARCRCEQDGVPTPPSTAPSHRSVAAIDRGVNTRNTTRKSAEFRMTVTANATMRQAPWCPCPVANTDTAVVSAMPKPSTVKNSKLRPRRGN